MPEESRNKSRPTRIPEQKQISPEMEAQLQKRALARELYYRKLFFFRRVAIALMVVGVPLGIFSYFYAGERNRSESISSSTEIGEPLQDLELLLQNGSDFRLEVYSRRLDEELKTGILPRQLAALQNRLRISDELIRRDSDDESVRFGVLTKINTLSGLAVFDRNYDPDARQYCADLLDFCERHSSDDDPLVKNTANLGKFAAHIHFYLLNPTDEEFAKLESRLDEYVSVMTGEVYRVMEVAKCVRLMSRSENLAHVQKFNSRIADGLQRADDVALRSLGDEIRDNLVIGSANFEDLRQLVRISDPTTILELERLVTAIVASPNVSVSTYYKMGSTIEGLRQSNQNELEHPLMDELRAAAEKIEDKDKRKPVSAFFEHYDKRKNLIGQVFELGVDVTENSASPNEVPTVILFFGSAQPMSLEWIDALKGLDELNPSTTRYVLVCTDSQLNETFMKEAKEDFPNAVLIGPEDKSFYLEQCPIAHVPYVIILDQKNRVVSVNVDIDQIRNCVANLKNSSGN